MPTYPECAWDAGHQAVVIYWPLRDRGDTGPLSLVVTFDEGDDGYFAGELPADRSIWAIHAPSSGPFRLKVYPAVRLAPGLEPAEPLRSIRFDPALTVDPKVSLLRDQKLRGRRFRVDADIGRTAMSKAFEVPPGESLARFLKAKGWLPSGWTGYTVAHRQGDAQGPAAHPFRAQGQTVGVAFLRRVDGRPPAKDAVVIEGFDKLMYPVIRLDLTDLADGATRLADGVTFFHRPVGSDETIQIPGASLTVERDNGHTYLSWYCKAGCHRDLIGVHVRGGVRLQAQPPGRDGDVRIPFTGSTEPTDCIAVLYLGSEVWERPDEAAAFAPEQAGAPFDLDLDKVEIERFFAWAGADERVDRAGARLTGASRAESCTLYAYADFLGQVLARADGEDDGKAIARLLRRLGLGSDSFDAFARRPDVAYAAVCGGALQARLLAAGARLNPPARSRDLSPLAYLAAALEPEDPDLVAWAESQAPEQQALLWRLLVAGVSLSELRGAGLELDRPVADPVGFAERLRRGLDEGERRIAAETLADLGLDPGPLAGAPQRLSSLETTVSLLNSARAAVAAELDQATERLAKQGWESHLNPEAAMALLGGALQRDRVADRATLRRKIRELCDALEIDPRNLLDEPHGPKTRAALLALAGALEEAWSGPPPTVDCIGPVYAWCRQVLAGEEARWSDAPTNVPSAAERGEIDAEVGALERRLRAHSEAERHDLPAWSGGRQARHEARVSALLEAADAARHKVQPGKGGADGQCREALALIERVEGLASWIASQEIWDRARLALSEADPDDPRLPHLHDRCATAVDRPSKWDEIAAAIEELP